MVLAGPSLYTFACIFSRHNTAELLFSESYYRQFADALLIQVLLLVSGLHTLPEDCSHFFMAAVSEQEFYILFHS